MAKLKVFSWSNGFHRFTVAATSKPKALEAWGLSQDIFKTGLATETPDAPDAEAALSRPGEVIQRGEAVDVGEVAAAPRRPKKAATKPAPKGPSAADLRRVAKLEADLDALDARHEAALEAIEAKRAALEDDAASQREKHRKARADLRKKLDAARARL
ncbi:MAG TPA: hypothetical protein VGR32_00120 [Brevundimonas sp.]|jgi:hypothetical protein|uniref:hypothetical protein n=1 Tax=Brevundimonas sp. TaxID=1871086 RepID=UPI002DE75655|nr:hypothetical protein [Brevundimonas sp.]